MVFLCKSGFELYLTASAGAYCWVFLHHTDLLSSTLGQLGKPVVFSCKLETINTVILSAGAYCCVFLR